MGAETCANHAFGSNCCWVSFDCDQIAPIEYLCACLKTYGRRKHEPGLAIICQSHAQLTGRIAFRGIDFMHLGGYDQDGTPPSGGQDVDYRQRLGLVASAPHHQNKKQSQYTLDGEHVLGGALPNDFTNTDRAHARVHAKTVNVSPEDQEKYQSPTRTKSLWAQMNDQGWSDTFLRRLKKNWRPEIRKYTTDRFPLEYGLLW